MEPEAVMLGLTCFTLMSMLLTLTAAAFVFARFWSMSNARRSIKKDAAADFFMTARNAGSSWLLVCAWYTCGGGSWVVGVLGIYGYYYGYLGMLWYAFMNGCVPMVTSVFSVLVFRIIPRSETSLPASIGTRYGCALEMQMLVLMLFTELVTLTSEYMAVSLLLKEVLGIEQYVTLTLYGCFSAIYTIFGGALVGLFTAQFHAMISLLSVVALFYYFMDVSPSTKAPSKQLQAYSSSRKATLTSLYGGFFSQAITPLYFSSLWQKTICSPSNRTTLVTAAYGGLLVTVVCAFFGAAGVLASWQDMAAGTYFTGTAYLLYLDPKLHGITSIRDVWDPYQYWFGVTLLVYATVASKATIESWTDGLLCSVYGSMRMRSHRLLVSRVVVICLNVLALRLAASLKEIQGCFNLAAMLGACLAPPLFLSLCIPRLSRIATQGIVITPSITGYVALAACGVAHAAVTLQHVHPRPSWHVHIKKGLKLAFYMNGSLWQYLCLSLGVPTAVYAALMLLRVWQMQRCPSYQYQRRA